ncbi:MAG: molybdopterin cofactor-binding domain-containing protein [Pseudomonadota bacterium]
MTLQTTKTTRRGFLTGSGILGFALFASGSVSVFRDEVTAQAASGGPVNAWVTITPDDEMTIFYGGAEMGQGVNTSLPMIIAEELDADWSTVSVEAVSADPTGVFGNPGFGGILFSAGSSTLEGYYTYLRQAGANARMILIHTAAAHWGVNPEDVTTEPGTVVHSANGQRMRYGAVAALPALVTDFAEPGLKPRDQWRIMGTDIPREDIPGKTRGDAIYSIDVTLPNMVYASQMQAPVEGEEPVSIDDTATRATSGVVDVIKLKNSVAVLADTFWAAQKGREALEVEWTENSPFRSANSAEELTMLTEAASNMDHDSVPWETRGDAVAAFGAGTEVHSSEYITEHVYHAQMEPLNAIAHVDEDGLGADIWLGSQSQTVSIGVAAGVLGTTPDRIRANQMQMGGAFGRRTVFAKELLRDALLLSREARRPVKLVWTR